MGLKDLLQEYQNTPRLFQLADRLSFVQPQKIFLKNLQGSSSQFIIASAILHPSCTQHNHIIILNDAEEAAYFHNSLENLTGAFDPPVGRPGIFYFPASFKNRKNYQLLNSSHVMLRTEALPKIAGGGNKKVLVTCPEALFEKVVKPSALSSNIILIKTGDNLNVGELLLKLADLGFERTDFVYEPGQFAIRGGILDIYSFGNEKPYRIELFGNDVDSIRIVDPETQLSERKLLQVTIIPNVEAQISTEEKISLFEFLPENTIVWIQDFELCAERLAECEDDLQAFFNMTKNTGIISREAEPDKLEKKNSTKDDFIKPESLEEMFSGKHLVEIGYQSHLADLEIEFQTKIQPAFNRRFDLLIQDLKNWEAKKFQVYIFAENPKQLERLQSIFDDLKAAIVFHPITTSIHEGFIDLDQQIVCYTDHQVFQRYHKYKVKQAYNKNKALTLRTLRELQPGDFVTHIDHGVGVFSGLQKLEINGKLQEAVRLIYKDTDILYVNINSLHKIAKYTGKEGSVPKVNKLGSDTWNKLKEKTKTKVKEIAFDLIKLYAKRKAQQGFPHAPDNYMQTELEASFIYEDTPD
ncbi:MAG: CarD family transcriptional regulator, partial [Chitinophagaceae bacterium]